MLAVRYMGSKRSLATTVADIMVGITPNVCVDLFSGMCSVAAALSDKRSVIANDIQVAAAFAATTFIASAEPPPTVNLLDLLVPYFTNNYEALEQRFVEDLAIEAFFLTESLSQQWAEYREWSKTYPHVGSTPNLYAEASSQRLNLTFPYRLFSITFPNSYFGLRQCLEIDSIRYAIDSLVAAGEVTVGAGRWLLVALMQAVSHVASSPGHFAQYLTARDERSYDELRKLRRRSILEQLRAELSRMEAPGSEGWRTSNRVLNADALTVIPQLPKYGNIGCIYADPPYTGAQYSRFYHVLETLVRYDYPGSDFKGRYRPDRYQAPFGRVTQVAGAFDRLAQAVASIQVPLLLSYPSTGILAKTGFSPESILGRHFRRVDLVMADDHRHSTLGASTGQAKVPVQEYLFLAMP